MLFQGYKIFIVMKNPKTYTEIKDANYIMEMMKEDVFGHRVTSWSPKDTLRLKNKLREPLTDKEKEMHVAVVEPLMNKKSYVPKEKDAFLDSFVDLTTRVSPKDFDPSEDPDAEELDSILGVDLT